MAGTQKNAASARPSPAAPIIIFQNPSGVFRGGYRNKAVAANSAKTVNAVKLCAVIVRAILIPRIRLPMTGLRRIRKRPYSANGDRHRAEYSENAFLINTSPTKYGFNM